MNQPHTHITFRATVSILVLISSSVRNLDAGDAYQDRITPFTKKYCVSCHNSKKARGELDLGRYQNAGDVVGSFRRWNHIIAFIRDGEMPPESAEQPTLKEREAVVAEIETILLTEAGKRAGDPGVILPRRLSNTEYDQSIFHLTGVNVRPTRTFPPDPAAGEGFNNTGEALSMSPSLLKKYLQAAQEVSQHLVLKTSGITFAPFPVTSYNERKKLTEQAVIDFYNDHEVHVLDYLTAAWRYRHRSKAEQNVSIEAWAQRSELSEKYLALIWSTLSKASSTSGYLKRLGEKWDALPAPATNGNVPRELVELNRYVEFCQQKLCHRKEQLIRSNAGNWPIGHLDFRAKTAAKRDQFDPGVFASRRLIRLDRIRAPRKNDQKTRTLYLRIDPAFAGSQDTYVLLHRPIFSRNGNLPRNKNEEQRHQVVTLRAFLQQQAPEVLKRLAFGRHPKGHAIDPDSLAVKAPTLIEIPLGPEMCRLLDGKQLLLDCELDPEHGNNGIVHVLQSMGNKPDQFGDGELLVNQNSELAKEMHASAQLFCHTFPNRFFYVDNRRGLAAGFHLVEGFFRDDKPLMEKVLSDEEKQQLDELWEELNFVTNTTETLIRGFVWFERSERHVLHDKRFDFLRPEDPKLIEMEMLNRFEKVYLGKMGVKLIDDTLKPVKPNEDRYRMIHGFFEQIRHGLAHQKKLTEKAGEKGLSDLEAFATRAYRRSLSEDEIESLRGLYQRLRKEKQSVEDSLRGTLTAILMSPNFCYLFTDVAEGDRISPLSNDAVASRLSYFLWSSVPDDKLLSLAKEGKLQEKETLQAQTRRMLKDPKIETFAREFFGQWLRYREYLSKDPINSKSFPGYTDELRQSFFEEPTRIATYLIQNDRPITDLLNSDFTFVNGVLAKHYGGDIAKQYQNAVREWSRDRKVRGGSAPIKPEEVWHRVDGLKEAGRGGLFGMGVILTKNSAGERTSPVKRGFWAAHHLLGQHFPPPPADVPELPANEKKATQTIRALLRLHVANPRCALCHTHFDGLGLAMEGFDPIGRARTKDLAGRAIDNVASLPTGKTAKGIPGLIEYVETHRKKDFVRTFCRRFLGYALGRSVLLSDQPLLKEMEVKLEKNGYRFSVLFETVVQSSQFRQQRGRNYVTRKQK